MILLSYRSNVMDGVKKFKSKLDGADAKHFTKNLYHADSWMMLKNNIMSM